MPFISVLAAFVFMMRLFHFVEACSTMRKVKRDLPVCRADIDTFSFYSIEKDMQACDDYGLKLSLH